MILEARKLQRLSRNKIEQMIGVDGTIYKAYDDDREPADSEIVRKLIGTLGIRQAWWDKDWETGSMDIFNTPVTDEPAIAEKTLGEPWEVSAFRKIFEGDAAYILVHKAAFHNHRFTSVEQIEAHAKERAEMIAEIGNLSKMFMKFVNDLHGLGRVPELPKIEETKKDTTV